MLCIGFFACGFVACVNMLSDCTVYTVKTLAQSASALALSFWQQHEHAPKAIPPHSKVTFGDLH